MQSTIGRTYDELFLRANRDINNTISTFTNKHTAIKAIKAIKENLKHHATEIASWLADKPSLDAKKICEYSHVYQIGEGIIKGKKNSLHPLVKSKMVLIPDQKNDFGFKILTSFPI